MGGPRPFLSSGPAYGSASGSSQLEWSTGFVLEFTMNLPLHWETHGFQAPKDHPSASFPGFWHMPAKLKTEPAFRSVWVCVGVCVCLCLAIFYPSIYLPIIIYPSTSSHLSIPIHPYIHLSTHYPSIHLSIYHLSIYRSISLSLCLYLFIYPSIYPSIYRSLYLSIPLFL